MPLPAGVQEKAVRAAGYGLRTPVLILAGFVTLAMFVPLVVHPGAQADIAESQLDAASGGRTIRIGAVATGRVSTIPLETYVARVLAGEAEPRAAAAAQQALAIAIRTFALANASRHGSESFDLCDSTHCQVLRASTAATRRAALTTAGRVLMWNGRPAEVFYSASCGGRTERVADVWPGADFPYLQGIADDDVHADDRSWTVDFTLRDIQQALRRAGFEGDLRSVAVMQRSASGRVIRLMLSGLRPDVIAGDQFRGLLGAGTLRSTAFEMEQRGSALHFTGRGYGHGVGLCVIGAGRRALRGESAEEILAAYFPGLTLTGFRETASGIGMSASVPPVSGTSPPGFGVPDADVMTLVTRAHADLSAVVGVAVAPITARVHPTIESFRLTTGRPWWVSVVANGTSIELAPAAILAQREGLEAAVRLGVAELLVAGPLAQRPAWVRMGAARYFAAGGRTATMAPRRCPSDAELTMAISAAAQREAESRAEACFARALPRARTWRDVR